MSASRPELTGRPVPPARRRRVSGPRIGATRLALALATLVASALVVVLPQVVAAAADPCGAGGNEIACENSKPGAPPVEWDLPGAGDDSIMGFATDISVDVGDRIDFKIDTDADDYELRIYRTGWYGGDGARLIDTVQPSATLPQVQPPCISEQATELVDCGNWGVSASWDVPADAVSGVYLAYLYREDLDEASHVTFIVRDDDSDSDLVFQTSDPTWQAYNTYGGSDFYRGGGQRARLQGQLQPPGADPGRDRRPGLLLRQRVPVGAVPGEERVRRQLPGRGRHRSLRRPAPQPPRVPLGGP